MKKLNNKKQLQENIKALDVEIGVLTQELINADGHEYNEISLKIEKLTEIRAKMVDSKVADSYSKEIISGVIGIAGMVLVLKHEKADIITTKAFSMATKLFRG